MYAYDAAGRLVGVTDPAGETARYRYDAAGNRLGIDRFASSQLTVLSLVPVRAPVGATVTLSGTGFATAAPSNAVSFGGASAEVVSASASRLVVKVPVGAAGGSVSVSVGGKTVQSPETFTVAPPGPAITKIEPVSGAPGTQVVVSGSGFAAAATDNVVRFNGGAVAGLVSVTATSVTVTVPQGATTGRLQVETPDGQTTAASDFTVPLSGGEDKFETTVRTSVTDNAPPSVPVTRTGKQARVLFDAEQGDDIGFGFSASTFTAGLRLKLVDPLGREMPGSTSVSSNGGDWEVQSLPLSGTYSLVLDPGSGNTGAVTVTVSYPVGGTLDYTGPAADMSLSRPGQDGKLAFSGVLGQSLSLGINGAGMTKALYARLLGPDGKEVAYDYVSAKSTGSLDLDTLAQSGRYTLIIDPDAAGTGTVTLTASHYADAGALDPAGPAVELSLARAGQNGIARFSAEAGQRVSIGATATGFATSTQVDVRRPNGTRLDSFSVSTGSPEDWDSTALPESGTYTLAVQPGGDLDTGKLTLTLSRPVDLAQLATTGDPVQADIGRFAQNAESLFQAEAGADLSLGITGNTFTTYLHVSVIAPSGAKTVDAAYVSAQFSYSCRCPTGNAK